MTIRDAETKPIWTPSTMGRKGGSVKGPQKAQTPDFYSRIGKLGAQTRANKRWQKYLQKLRRQAKRAKLKKTKPTKKK